jgi:tRNA-splicing ligase RtcB
MRAVTKEGPFLFTISPSGAMRVPVKIFASEEIVQKMQEDGSLEQACNVASLPGIVGSSVVLPDAHQGYGFSIGGVAAFDLQEGIISPGGIGFDINCGVRMLATSLDAIDVEARIPALLDALYTACPVGVGAKGVIVTDEQMREVMREGAAWAVRHGYGTQDDLEHCEAQGCLPDSDPKDVPQRALQRGKSQLGTVGAGNHFVEVQRVERIVAADVARAFGLTHEGQVVVMIHCGSRGFGHQICADYIRIMEDAQPELVRTLKDRDLIYAPLGSDLARRYWGAMNAAANFAFCNRHILGHRVREVFQDIFGKDTSVRTVYDVCHNIAKRERHIVDGRERELLVHRKGATRALPAGSDDVPNAYRGVGQPVLIPGSMGTASWVLVGAPTSLAATFGSTAHGAGRMMSRSRAARDFPADIVTERLARAGVRVKAASRKGIAEEAPGAYKDVDAVIDVSDRAGIARKVARVVPMGVIKG